MKYLLRLDDACNTMNTKLWNKMEKLLDKYNLCPIVGVIPDNKDDNLKINVQDNSFWEKVKKWQNKGWEIAMHGYDHVYISKNKGLNPIHNRSEFAGVEYYIQKEKIAKGYNIFKGKGFSPKVFFAPSHTFDKNTLKVLKEMTDIRIISDTIANDIYKEGEFYFIPQQTGKVRKLPFSLVTFCYHPNDMKEKDFITLEEFIIKNKDRFIKFKDLKLKNRSLNLYDKFLKWGYFTLRRIR